MKIEGSKMDWNTQIWVLNKVAPTWLTLSYHEIGSGAGDQEIDKQDNKPLSPDGLVDILEDLYLLLHPHQTARNQLYPFPVLQLRYPALKHRCSQSRSDY